MSQPLNAVLSYSVLTAHKEPHRRSSAVPCNFAFELRRSQNRTKSKLDKTKSIMDPSMKAIQEAMAKLSLKEKEAFLEACERAPEIVLAESDPSEYVAFEKGNAEAAAARMARYWQLRRNHFGDRAYLPMELTGEGTLSQEIVDKKLSDFKNPRVCRNITKLLLESVS